MTSSAKQPNILIIYTDQQRRDSLGCYGNLMVQTPHIDALAAGGSLIEDCHVSCPICVPSRVAFWSGRWGSATDSIDNMRSNLLPDEERNLAVHAKQHGYRTALIGKDHCFSEARQHESFDHTAHASHRVITNPQTPAEARVHEVRGDAMQRPLLDDPMPTEESITHWCFDRTADFITDTSTAGQPFCCWLSIPDPHPPFMVSEPYASMYDGVAMPPPIWDDGQMDNRPYRHQLGAALNRTAVHYPGEDIDKLRRIYWGMVSQIDAGVGRLMAHLEQLGLREDTIIVYTSDHGEYLGDHRMVRKGVANAACLTAVPLIFSYPGTVKAQRSAALASNVDCYATICDLAGLPKPPQLQGYSFAKHLTGDAPAPRPAVFSHFGIPGRFIAPTDAEAKVLQDEVADPNPSGNPLLSMAMRRGLSLTVRTSEWTYTHNLGEVDELYDRGADPHEQWNLADRSEHTAIIAELRAKIADWFLTTTLGATQQSKIADPDWRPIA